MVQSRCPTRLIEDGRTSRIAVEDRGGLGWGVAVGGAVAAAVGVCVGAAVVAAGVAPVRAASGVVPQAANALASRSALSNTAAQRTMNRRKVTGHTADLLIGIGARRVTKAFAGVLRGGCPVRVNGRRSQERHSQGQAPRLRPAPARHALMRLLSSTRAISSVGARSIAPVSPCDLALIVAEGCGYSSSQRSSV